MAGTDEKILSVDEARARAGLLRGEGKRLTTVNGSFDLLTVGHLTILEEAKAQGEVVFVGLNADASVRANKGASRPILPEGDRARLLAALSCVDFVVILNESEAGGAIVELIRPNVHVNGSEYGPPERWVEYPVLQRYGTRPHVCRRRPGYATTEIIAKIQREGARMSVSSSALPYAP